VTHPRTLVYLGIWTGIGLALLFMLGNRQRIDLTVAKDRNPPFLQMSNGEVRNDFTLKLRNMETRPRPMAVTLEGLPEAKMWTDEMGQDRASRRLEFTVAADQVKPVRVYVIAPEGTRQQSLAFALAALDREGGADRSETRFDAPEENQ
jgi:polyferredoxin